MATRPLPSPEVVRQLISYDPETGKLFWLFRDPEWFKFTDRTSAEVQARIWNGQFAGKEAFTPINSKGYHTRAILRKMLLAHRVAWAVHYGEWPSGFLDHLNGVRTDNRICNLRKSKNGQNMMNRGVLRNNESGIKGVRLDKRSGRWNARITANGNCVSLGYFDTSAEASAAWAEAAKELHGAFANSGA